MTTHSKCQNYCVWRDPKMNDLFWQLILLSYSAKESEHIRNIAKYGKVSRPTAECVCRCGKLNIVFNNRYTYEKFYMNHCKKSSQVSRQVNGRVADIGLKPAYSNG
jgi:hypothetical protein